MENLKDVSETSHEEICFKPLLRFEEFNSEWELIKLNEFLEFINTNLLSRSKLNFEKRSLKNIHYGDIHTKFPTLVDCSVEKIPYICPNIDISKFKDEQYCKNGDLIIADASEDYENIGKAVELINVNEKIVSGLHTILARYKLNKTALGFKGYLFLNESLRKNIKIIANGVSVLGISKNNLAKLEVKLPSFEEQNKIANFLSLIDKKIILLEKTLFLYQKHNQYIKNNYFDNLKTENIVKFKEIIKKGKAGGTPKSTNKDYYDGEIPFLSINDMTTQGKYITTTEKSITNDGLNNSSAWIIPKNSLLYSIYASIGFVSINKIDLSTSQAIYGIILKENINNNFIYHYLKNFKRYIHRYIETGTQGNLNSKIVQNIEIKLPSSEEQNYYTNLFDTLDKQIEIKEKEIAMFKDFKKGLLQKMFI